MTHQDKKISRRFAMQCFAGAGGSFVLGFNLPVQAASYLPQPKVFPDEINAFIEISAEMWLLFGFRILNRGRVV